MSKRQDKPILLSISATWCHWCHAMDETSYVDMGGWPTTAFLMPDGEVITGGTYIPISLPKRSSPCYNR